MLTFSLGFIVGLLVGALVVAAFAYRPRKMDEGQE